MSQRDFITSLRRALRQHDFLPASAARAQVLALPALEPRFTPRRLFRLFPLLAPVPAGVRATSTATPPSFRWSLYRLDPQSGLEGTLELLIERVGPSHLSVVGQLLTPDGEGLAGCSVHVSSDDPLNLVCQTNAAGEFSLPGTVPASDLRLRLVHQSAAFELHPLPLP